jgi:hypothetical protein
MAVCRRRHIDRVRQICAVGPARLYTSAQSRKDTCMYLSSYKRLNEIFLRLVAGKTDYVHETKMQPLTARQPRNGHSHIGAPTLALAVEPRKQTRTTDAGTPTVVNAWMRNIRSENSYLLESFQADANAGDLALLRDVLAAAVSEGCGLAAALEQIVTPAA